MAVNLLLWEKWRPKKIEDLILLPRIRKHFENGVNQHYIFYGHWGTGKTSLSRILIGKYSKETPFMEVNCSEETSIDFLREEISTFCRTKPMFSDSDVKYVFLDEFERVSAQFQDAFKAFIEKYNDKGVIFILTTNHIEKIGGGLKSRIKMLNFDCESVEEERYLKKEFFNRIKSVILPAEGKDVPKEELIRIVTKRFPDFRNTLVELQDYLETGTSSISGNISNKVKQELYDVLFNTDTNYDKIYHFLMGTFGAEKIDQMIKILGRPLVDYVVNNYPDKVDKLFECNYIITDYSSKLDSNTTDPLILGMTIIGKLKELLN